MSYIPKESELYHYALGGNIAEGASLYDRLKSPIGRAALNPLNTYRLSGVPYNILTTSRDLQMSFLLPDRANKIDDGLAYCPPPDDFIQLKGDLSWSQWLRTSPRKGGSTKQQLNQLLEWNLEEMKRRNREHGPVIDAQIDAYGENLTAAVEAGTIDESMLACWHTVQDKITAVISPPISYYGKGGSAFTKQRLFYLSDAVDSQDFISHELTHLLGQIKDWRLNEPITDILSFAIDKKDSVQNTSIYLFAVHLIGDLLLDADIDTKTLSRHYAGKSRKHNLRDLRQNVQRATGHDSIGQYTRDVKDLTAVAKKNWRASARYLFGPVTAQLFMNKKMLTSYQEVWELLPEDHKLRTEFDVTEFEEFMIDIYGSESDKS